MTEMKIRVSIVLFGVALFLFGIACGGGPSRFQPPANPAPHAQVVLSPIPGTHVFGSQPGQSARLDSFSLVPTVHAQDTPPLTLTQSFQGKCQAVSSDDPYRQHYLYGLGGLTYCVEVAQPPEDTPLIIGDGTLQNFVAWASIPPWLGIADAGVGTTVHVFILRNDATLDTGIGCTLGRTGSYLRCASPNTFAVQDGDMVYAIVDVTNATGQTVWYVNAVFTK